MHRIIRAATVGAMAATIGITSAAAASATAKPSVTGTEHISLMSTSPSLSTYSFIGTGAFTAGGTDIAGKKVDTIKLPGGTFKLQHAGSFKSGLNPKTCLVTVDATGTYKLVGGTGAYKGISGSGKFVLASRAVIPRTSTGACSRTAGPVALEFLATGSGPVSLP